MATVDLLNYASLKQEKDMYNSFDYIEPSISYSEFFEKYLLSNRPCILRNISTSWNCQKEWVKENCPNFLFLLSAFGNSVVPVADCSVKYYNSQPKINLTFDEYVDYWKKFAANGYDSSERCLYLKDWHLCREYPSANVYQVPVYFISDWLNEYYMNHPDLNDDYRFVYMGPKTSWTPFHRDVFTSFSWSVNLCGKKEWAFYPPWEESSLTDSRKNLVYDLDSINPSDFPDMGSPIRVSQGPGDAIFVPSGWFHQVWNREDTISLNHNMVNGCNIKVVLNSLLEELGKVEAELADCSASSDWHESCQRLLLSTFGLDLRHFLSWMSYLTHSRVNSIDTPLTLPFSDFTLGFNQIQFDLNALKDVLSQLMTLQDYFDILDDADNLIGIINNAKEVN